MIIDHINRYVSDVDAMISFYTDALDFVLLDKGIKKDGNYYAILGGGEIELFISENDTYEDDSPSSFRHMGFRVDNAAALLASLKEKGYIAKDEQLIVKAFSRQFYMKDPDGFELDFIEWTDKEKFYSYMAEKNASIPF